MQNHRLRYRRCPIWKQLTRSCLFALCLCLWRWWNIVWSTSFWETRPYPSRFHCRHHQNNRLISNRQGFVFVRFSRKIPLKHLILPTESSRTRWKSRQHGLEYAMGSSKYVDFASATIDSNNGSTHSDHTHSGGHNTRTTKTSIDAGPTTIATSHFDWSFFQRILPVSLHIAEFHLLVHVLWISLSLQLNPAYELVCFLREISAYSSHRSMHSIKLQFA